jgi:rubrerythrin
MIMNVYVISYEKIDKKLEYLKQILAGGCKLKSLKGTKTAENLLKSFVRESQAINKYTYYASVAKKEGYVQIENIFIEAVVNKKNNTERFFKLLARSDLNGESVVINDSSYRIFLGDTKANLLATASGKNEEWTTLYPNFGDVAQEEEFSEIAIMYRNIAEVEKRHEARYEKLAKNIENGTAFLKNGPNLWKCNNCGFIFEDSVVPKVCPACADLQSYFEIFAYS